MRLIAPRCATGPSEKSCRVVSFTDMQICSAFRTIAAGICPLTQRKPICPVPRKPSCAKESYPKVKLIDPRSSLQLRAS